MLTCFAAAPAGAPVRFDITAQPLEEALLELARQAGFNIKFDVPIPKGIVAHPLKAELTPDDAFARVLAGTQLRAVHVDDHTVSIITREESDKHRDKREVASSATEKANQGETLEQVIVTGSYLPEVGTLAPVITKTRADFVNQGYTRLDEWVAQMPQNFSSASEYSNPIVGHSPEAANNQTFASTADVFGLGPGASLTLLNGCRLPNRVNGQSADIFSIPLNIIEHVDLLMDGSSAIYGSDAIGGVVNLVTPGRFSGVDATVRVDGISAGKEPNYGGNITAGSDLPKGLGNAWITVGHDEDRPLLADARPFTRGTIGPTNLVPKQQTTSAYAQAELNIADGLAPTIDVLASDRRYSASDSAYADLTILHGRADLLSIAASLQYKISPAWTLDVVGQLPGEKDLIVTAYPSQSTTRIDHYTNQAPSAESYITGRLLGMPGGDLRAALGATFRVERFELDSSYQPSISAQRRIASVFSELFVPLVGKSNQKPLMKELSIDLSGRYDHYSDFGKNSNPKISARWRVSDSVSLHGTYSQSFRAPTPYELHATQFAQAVPPPSSTSPTSPIETLLIDGGNARLQPERARSVDIGTSYESRWLPGFGMDVSEFEIDYRRKIDQLSDEGFTATQAIQDAPALGSLITLNPKKSEIEQVLSTPGLVIVTPIDVNSVGAIAYMGYANIGSSRVDGLDVRLRYRQDVDAGGITGELSSFYFRKYDNRVTPGSPETSFVGTAYHPPRFRANLNMGRAWGVWSTNARLNFTGSYHNLGDPACPVAPGCRVSEWATVDATLIYLPAGFSSQHGTHVALSISNVFEREPPRFHGVAPGLNFDPANANPMGRVFAIDVKKSWGGE